MFISDDEKKQLKGLTVFQKVLTMRAIGPSTTVPWHVWRCFGSQQKEVLVSGTDVCLGEDYVSLEEARKAVDWYVEELGGQVKWHKNA